MLDPNYVRDNLEAVQTGMTNRGLNVTTELQQLATAESHRRRLIPQIEGLKREQNTSGDQVARAKRQGQDASHLFEASKQRAQKIKQLEFELDSAERQRTMLLETLPNLPHASVPVGKSAADNVVVRTWGEPRKFDFEPKAHWDLGPELGIIDFERATKISGTRFAFLMGAGAQLERALINFMLSLHTNEHGYTEVRAAVSGVVDDVVWNGAVAEVRAGSVQDRGRVGSVSDPDRGSAGHEPVSRRDPRRQEAAVEVHGLHAVLSQRSRIVRRRHARA